jgi:UDP-glucose 4-epimerase
MVGAGGLIGHALAQALIADGHRIVRIGRQASDDVAFDLADGSALSPGALAGSEALIHAAGVTDEDFSDRDRAFRKANHGAAALLKGAELAGIKRLIYVSSAHVYGPLEGLIDETRPPIPMTDYATAHFVTEQLFRRANEHSSAAVLLLRPCAVYGLPSSLQRFARWSLVPFDFPRQALSGRIMLKSNGLQRRNFVATESVASLAARWLKGPASGVAIANAPGPAEMSIYDFAQLCARIAGEERHMTCRVERPDALPSVSGPPLEYRSCHGESVPGPPLEHYLRQIIRLLAERAQ